MELTEANHTQKKYFDAIALASITFNTAHNHDVQSFQDKVILMPTFKKFLESRQMEAITDEDIKLIIQVSFPLN